MRSLKSGLIAIALSGLFGTLAIVGCSADGGSGGIDTETDPTLPGAGSGSVVPPRDDSDVGDPDPPGKTDAGKKDSGPKAEAGVDAGPPPPVSGTACTDITVKAKKPCGACGFAEALCQDDGTGATKWTDYGACGEELAGGCVPGTVVQEDCGNCGKVTKTCTQYCAYTSTACTGQPPNHCTPGTIEYTTASCQTPSTYKNRTCSTTCAWSGFSATCETPVNEIVLTLPATVGATSTKMITLSAAKQGSKLSGFTTCPQATNPTAGDFPYQYVELKNPSATKAATVTVYASTAPGGDVIDTIMAGYATALQPMDDAAKKACTYGANDQSSSDVALTGNADWSILKAVPIPAGGSILVYIASYYKNPTANEVTTGNLNMNVRVDALN